jgi:hypothetical protein
MLVQGVIKNTPFEKLETEVQYFEQDKKSIPFKNTQCFLKINRSRGISIQYIAFID